jgi:hypothetical protein
LIRKINQVDPLVCPKCGAHMRVIALIGDSALIGCHPLLARALAPTAHLRTFTAWSDTDLALRPAGPRFRGDDGIADLLRYSYRRERVDVGDHVDDDGPVGLQRLLERGTDLGGLLDADAEGADVLGDLREVLLRVGPELFAALGLLAAVTRGRSRAGETSISSDRRRASAPSRVKPAWSQAALIQAISFFERLTRSSSTGSPLRGFSTTRNSSCARPQSKRTTLPQE